jgi:mannose-6-phosphate isomerase-like protein (cupin superfamily)
MDEFSNAILRELLPVEKEPVPPKRTAKNLQNAMDHLSRPILLERAAYLRKLAAASDGSASEVLREYPRHAIHLLYRSRSGLAELHENFADLFFVLEGRAALVTGGTVADPKPIAPGEIRGESVHNGTRQELRAGDIAHVPAGLPHQMVVSGDASIICLVMKIQQDPEKKAGT